MAQRIVRKSRGPEVTNADLRGTSLICMKWEMALQFADPFSFRKCKRVVCTAALSESV
jgi:hypothetical protein